jgi:glycogen(starch) synthase
MNILVFTTAFYPLVGGLENQTFNLLEEFLRLGHKVKVIAIQTHPTPEQISAAKEKIVEVHYNPNLLKITKLFVWCHVFYMPNFSLKGCWFIPFSPFKKWIISHNDVYLSNKKNTLIKIKRLLIKLATQNIAVSKYVANYINTSSNVIYNCYDAETFRMYPGEVRKYEFVFLGRLVTQKGCELLIRACESLSKPFTLNIIGDGPERTRLELIVVELGLEDNVHFLGTLEDEPLARMLNRHHVMIIPSLGEEGFGIVALEGLACGCKIIAANAGGLPEAVNGFGKLFEMGNQKELECLLKAELEVLQQGFSPIELKRLDSYLTNQNKEAIAKEYLKFFK